MEYPSTKEVVSAAPQRSPDLPAFVTIPLGYICIPLEAYDSLRGRLNSLKMDFNDELRDQAATIGKLKQQLIEKTDEIANLKDVLEGVRKELKDTAYECFQANETVIALRKDIAELDEELLRQLNNSGGEPSGKAEE